MKKNIIISILVFALVSFFVAGGIVSEVALAGQEGGISMPEPIGDIIPLPGLINGEIHVNGAGVVMAKPDIALVNVGVETSSKNSSDAQSENATISNKVIESLKKIGIDEKDIKTVSYNMFRERYYDHETRKTVEGDFKVIHSLQIVVRNIDSVGAIIDTAVNSGANQVNNISFTVSDANKFYLEALKLAIKNANGKANAIANTMKITEIVPIEIIEINIAPLTRSMDMMLESKAVGSTQIETGELEIRANVQMVFNY
ncbi:SIMPL domain-containing protein [bacterium AH-315-G05]|nr:SIMPL domain-containing protein [bacterium AH-315-G05]